MKAFFSSLIFLAFSVTASENSELTDVQHYCHSTALPLTQAAADAVMQFEGDGKNYNELSIALTQNVFASQIYKSAPDNVQDAMRQALANDVLVKDKQSALVDMYIKKGENFLPTLAALWAYYSVEPYLIKCGYMKFSDR
ncbi:hypothetical protein SJI19_16615 [Acerihabitans sp. TG2]|uniref:hypothetical protein n=1 Tax=Acerihabitans sp. TG2 TaxID=3096008 RepID=UPI002B23B37F|nr:hypothetical protein [Acerihabitans sp. TG2]MEA9392148.1 hypothetical protein [Acerihabitans sp. TG2]